MHSCSVLLDLFSVVFALATIGDSLSTHVWAIPMINFFAKNAFKSALTLRWFVQAMSPFVSLSSVKSWKVQIVQKFFF